MEEVISALFYFFFFQAEDGIRDHCVTGVQTCALPISNAAAGRIVGTTTAAACGMSRPLTCGGNAGAREPLTVTVSVRSTRMPAVILPLVVEPTRLMTGVALILSGEVFVSSYPNGLISVSRLPVRS